MPQLAGPLVTVAFCSVSYSLSKSSLMRQSIDSSPQLSDHYLKELLVMKLFRLVSVAFIFSGLMISVHAQGRLMTSGGSSPGNSQPPPAAPMAIIDSGEFTDNKTGITRVIAALNQLNAKFEPVNTELKGMQARLTTMRTDIQNKQATQAVTLTAQQTDQANQLEVQIKRKAEDAQSNYQKQMATTLQPLQSDIGNALNAYAQSHGILLIIDSNRVPMIYVHNSIDITKDFIAEYNRTHPATTPAAPTRP
jgi:Skp family chaperone for outer membrane proteins